MYWRRKGDALRLSTGQSKKPWISFWCRSIVITWFKPDRHIILATSFDTMQPRLRILPVRFQWPLSFGSPSSGSPSSETNSANQKQKIEAQEKEKREKENKRNKETRLLPPDATTFTNPVTKPLTNFQPHALLIRAEAVRTRKDEYFKPIHEFVYNVSCVLLLCVFLCAWWCVCVCLYVCLSLFGLLEATGHEPEWARLRSGRGYGEGERASGTGQVDGRAGFMPVY